MHLHFLGSFSNPRSHLQYICTFIPALSFLKENLYTDAILKIKSSNISLKHIAILTQDININFFNISAN